MSVDGIRAVVEHTLHVAYRMPYIFTFQSIQKHIICHDVINTLFNQSVAL